jgi:UDP-N-acetylmuramoyl-tripeptide--D-alanyl-D-alanine ligase
VLAQVLADAGRTVATYGSFNNELGLPLTVLRADPTTQYLVLEMGARHVGDLAASCEVAPPQVSLVLNVGKAHLGEFGSQEAIARAKGEIVEALPAADEGGVAVLNADDPLVAAMAARSRAPVVLFGTSSAAQVRAHDLRVVAGRAQFTLTDGRGASAEVALRLVGAHQLGNALAAAAVGLHAGLSVGMVADALSTAEPASRWRMALTTRADGVSVLNDAYNANPDSMRVALESLVAVAAGRRTWAVVGEMLELGDAADAEHEAVGRLAAALGVDRLVAVGPGARPAHAGALLAPTWSGESVAVADVGAATELLHAQVRPGDVVLVKASRAVGLERVALALLDDGTRAPTSPDAGQAS